MRHQVFLSGSNVTLAEMGGAGQVTYDIDVVNSSTSYSSALSERRTQLIKSYVLFLNHSVLNEVTLSFLHIFLPAFGL